VSGSSGASNDVLSLPHILILTAWAWLFIAGRNSAWCWWVLPEHSTHSPAAHMTRSPSSPCSSAARLWPYYERRDGDHWRHWAGGYDVRGRSGRVVKEAREKKIPRKKEESNKYQTVRNSTASLPVSFRTIATAVHYLAIFAGSGALKEFAQKVCSCRRTGPGHSLSALRIGSMYSKQIFGSSVTLPSRCSGSWRACCGCVCVALGGPWTRKPNGQTGDPCAQDSPPTAA